MDYFSLILFVFVQWSMLGRIKLSVNNNISLGWTIILLTLFAQRYIIGQRYMISQDLNCSNKTSLASSFGIIA